MKNLDTVQSIVLKYENAELGANEATQLIKSLTGKDVSKYDLDNYYASQDLESFCRGLCFEPIKDWQDIDDEKAINLIEEILGDVSDDSMITRNAEALEKRYGKSTGTVTNLIFHDNLNASQVLNALKRQTTIQL